MTSQRVSSARKALKPCVRKRKKQISVMRRLVCCAPRPVNLCRSNVERLQRGPVASRSWIKPTSTSTEQDEAKDETVCWHKVTVQRIIKYYIKKNTSNTAVPCSQLLKILESGFGGSLGLVALSGIFGGFLKGSGRGAGGRGLSSIASERGRHVHRWGEAAYGCCCMNKKLLFAQ